MFEWLRVIENQCTDNKNWFAAILDATVAQLPYNDKFQRITIVLIDTIRRMVRLPLKPTQETIVTHVLDVGLQSILNSYTNVNYNRNNEALKLRTTLVRSLVELVRVLGYTTRDIINRTLCDQLVVVLRKNLIVNDILVDKEQQAANAILMIVLTAQECNHALFFCKQLTQIISGDNRLAALFILSSFVNNCQLFQRLFLDSHPFDFASLSPLQCLYVLSTMIPLPMATVDSHVWGLLYFETLVAVLQQQCPSQVNSNVYQRMLDYIVQALEATSKTTRKMMQRCLQLLLNGFSQSDTIRYSTYMSELLAMHDCKPYYCKIKYYVLELVIGRQGTGVITKTYPHIMTTLLVAIRDKSVSQTAGSAYVAIANQWLIELVAKGDQQQALKIWCNFCIEPIAKALHEACFSESTRFILPYVLQPIVQTHAHLSKFIVDFMFDLCAKTNMDSVVILMALWKAMYAAGNVKLNDELTIVDDKKQHQNQKEQKQHKALILPTELLQEALSHYAESVRLQALSILKQNRSYTKSALQLVMQAWKYLPDSSSEYHEHVIEHMELILLRYYCNVVEKGNISHLSIFLRECLEEIWLMLQPGCSFKMASTLLRVLSVAVRYNTEAVVSSLTIDHRRLLILYLLSPYETLRKQALNIVMYVSSASTYKVDQTFLLSLKQQAIALSRSPMPTDRMGSAQVFLAHDYLSRSGDANDHNISLLWSLIEMPDLNERSSIEQYYAYHALLERCLLIIPQPSLSCMDLLMQKLLTIVYQFVKMLNISLTEQCLADAKELAEATPTIDDNDGSLAVGVHWRGIIRASQILVILITSNNIDKVWLDWNHRITECFQYVLSTARHWGVTNTLLELYTTLCAHLIKSTDMAVRHVPKQWLDQAISNVINANVQAVDRLDGRYSGLGYTILAPLKAIVNGDCDMQNALAWTLSTLEQAIQQQDKPTQEVEVNAISVMCLIYRDTQLGKYCEQYFPSSLELALVRFDAPHASIRSAAGRLFGTILNRMFGNCKGGDDADTNTQRLSAKEFWLAYPSLKDIILDRLIAETALLTQQRREFKTTTLLPLIILLSRFAPDLRQNSTTIELSPFIAPLRCCLSARMYQMRSRASVALVAFVNNATHISVMSALIAQLSIPSCQHNEQHGILLTLKQLVSTFNISNTSINEITQLAIQFSRSRCKQVQLAYLDLLRSIDTLHHTATVEAMTCFSSPITWSSDALDIVYDSEYMHMQQLIISLTQTSISSLPQDVKSQHCYASAEFIKQLETDPLLEQLHNLLNIFCDLAQPIYATLYDALVNAMANNIHLRRDQQRLALCLQLVGRLLPGLSFKADQLTSQHDMLTPLEIITSAHDEMSLTLRKACAGLIVALGCTFAAVTSDSSLTGSTIETTLKVKLLFMDCLLRFALDEEEDLRAQISDTVRILLSAKIPRPPYTVYQQILEYVPRLLNLSLQEHLSWIVLGSLTQRVVYTDSDTLDRNTIIKLYAMVIPPVQCNAYVDPLHMLRVLVNATENIIECAETFTISIDAVQALDLAERNKRLLDVVEAEMDKGTMASLIFFKASNVNPSLVAIRFQLEHVLKVKRILTMKS